MADKFKNTIIGAVSVIVENSNHNNDLTGQPRAVDGIFTASSASLKAYVKTMLVRQGEKIFGVKTVDKNGKINDIISRIDNCEIQNTRDFFNFLDLKFFGHTILHSKKRPKSAINGPLNVEYGKNIFRENEYTTHQITGPFPSNNGEDSNDAGTVGTDVRVDKANYLHSFTFSPMNIERDTIMQTDAFKNDIPYFTSKEIEIFKHGFSNCVGSTVNGSYSSVSKSGTKIGLAVFITLREDCKYSISIKDNIKCGEEFNEYDLTDLFKKIDKNRDLIESVDIRYTEDVVTFTHDLPEKDKLYNISDRG
jgi:hypothetical protein